MSIGILFVCTGNICRSPTAEGVLRVMAAREGLAGELHIDSAGTWSGHAGEAPSKQACIAARKRGYDITGLRARPVESTDLARFDYLVAMDRSHLRHLADLAAPQTRTRLHLLLDFAPQLGLKDVPDPWYGGPADYEHALDLVETGCEGLLQHLRARHFTA